MDGWPKIGRNRPQKDNRRLPLDIPTPRVLTNFKRQVKILGKCA